MISMQKADVSLNNAIVRARLGTIMFFLVGSSPLLVMASLHFHIPCSSPFSSLLSRAVKKVDPSPKPRAKRAAKAKPVKTEGAVDPDEALDPEEEVKPPKRKRRRGAK